MLVEFYEDSVDGNQLIDAVEMAAAPQIGAVISFDILGDRSRYEVTAVLHVIQMRQEGFMLESRETLVRCALRQPC